MNFEVDFHTHTISSGHAYSTLTEMVASAKKAGLKMIAITDHGPAFQGAPMPYYFGNQYLIPRVINDIKILRGVELNILDFNGNVDLPVDILKGLDFVLAGFHEICLSPGSKKMNTKAVIKALQNPYINCISHPERKQFPIDFEEVVKEAKSNNKFLEINSQAFNERNIDNKDILKLATLCKKYEVKITCGSDAHICYDVGKFDKTINFLEKIDFPKELILNINSSKVEKILNLSTK